MLMILNWNYKKVKSSEFYHHCSDCIDHTKQHKKIYWHTFSRSCFNTTILLNCGHNSLNFILYTHSPHRHSISCFYFGFWFTRTARKNSISYECCNPKWIRFNKKSVWCYWVVAKVFKLSRFFFFFCFRSFQINSYGSFAEKKQIVKEKVKTSSSFHLV